MNDPAVTRLRHERARRRTLRVAEKRRLAPNYLSIHFRCDDFEDFVSAAADDHVKLFVPGMPRDAGRPPMRDYTPRSFEAETGEFVIEFALHDSPGPATAWAMACEPGDTIEIGGPRGSGVIAATFDWYWLIGDETALAAIARRLEEWPTARIEAFMLVGGSEEEIALPVSGSHLARWIHRPPRDASDPAALLGELAVRALPRGDGFVWIAAEAGVAKAAREAVLAKGQPLNRIKAAGYWTCGAADTTERFD